MVAINPDTVSCLTPATREEIQLVSKEALKIWEHEAVQSNLTPSDTPQMVNSAIQPIGRTDVTLSFVTTSSSYPEIVITTDGLITDLDSEGDKWLQAARMYKFVTRQGLFGLPSYKPVYTYESVNFMDATVDCDDEGEYTPPRDDSKLSVQELAALQRGRAESSRIFTSRHAWELVSLLGRFDPGIFAVHLQMEPQTTEE